MQAQTIAYGEVTEGLVVFVGGKTVVGPREWQAHLRFVESLALHARTTWRPLHILVFAQDGGVPDAKQRVALVEALRDVASRTALVTHSAIARHVITAFGWLSFPIKTFSPTHIADAACYLSLAPAALKSALSVAISLAPSVGGSPSVQAAANAVNGAQG